MHPDFYKSTIILFFFLLLRSYLVGVTVMSGSQSSPWEKMNLELGEAVREHLASVEGHDENQC